MSHTPTPWIAEPYDKTSHDWVVRSEDYGPIVVRNCYPEPKVDTRVEADAKFIANACNNYDELVDICKKAVKTFEQCDHDFKTNSHNIRLLLNRRIAIAEGNDA